jgi:hypothetical protein
MYEPILAEPSLDAAADGDDVLESLPSPLHE